MQLAKQAIGVVIERSRARATGENCRAPQAVRRIAWLNAAVRPRLVWRIS
jgi:hypothetical protein